MRSFGPFSLNQSFPFRSGQARTTLQFQVLTSSFRGEGMRRTQKRQPEMIREAQALNKKCPGTKGRVGNQDLVTKMTDGR